MDSEKYIEACGESDNEKFDHLAPPAIPVEVRTAIVNRLTYGGGECCRSCDDSQVIRDWLAKCPTSTDKASTETLCKLFADVREAIDGELNLGVDDETRCRAIVDICRDHTKAIRFIPDGVGDCEFGTLSEAVQTLAEEHNEANRATDKAVCPKCGQDGAAIVSTEQHAHCRGCGKVFPVQVLVISTPR